LIKASLLLDARGLMKYLACFINSGRLPGLRCWPRRWLK